MSDKKRKLTIHDLPWGTKFKLKGFESVHVYIGENYFANEDTLVFAWQDNMEIREIFSVGRWVSVDNMRYEDGQWWVSHG